MPKKKTSIGRKQSKKTASKKPSVDSKQSKEVAASELAPVPQPGPNGLIAPLPQEILLMVFGLLDHSSIRKSVRVCRGFRDIVTLKQFDRVLFRGPVLPTDAPLASEAIQINPVFDDLIYCACHTKIEDVKLINYERNDDGCNPWLLKTTSAASELATCPGVSRLRMSVCEYKPFEVTNATGVTVYQAMKAVCRFFNRKVPVGFEGAQYGITQAEAMGNHNGT